MSKSEFVVVQDRAGRIVRIPRERYDEARVNSLRKYKLLRLSIYGIPTIFLCLFLGIPLFLWLAG